MDESDWEYGIHDIIIGGEGLSLKYKRDKLWADCSVMSYEITIVNIIPITDTSAGSNLTLGKNTFA